MKFKKVNVVHKKIIPNQELIRNQKNLASLLVDEAPGLLGETGTVCPEAE
jgi:hypothetical protein